MYQFSITAYFIILGLAIYYGNITFIASWLILGIITVLVFPLYKKIKKENIKKEIINKTALININKAPWWIIEELPGFKSVSAKKAVWIRKHNGKYLSKEDFYTKNLINNKDEIEKFIIL